MTNADRIRAMTDEELAEWFSSEFSKDCDLCPDYIYEGDCPAGCTKKWLNWLKQEATEVAHECYIDPPTAPVYVRINGRKRQAKRWLWLWRVVARVQGCV